MRNASIDIPVLRGNEVLCIFDEGIDDPLEQDDGAEWTSGFTLHVVPAEARAVGGLVSKWLFLVAMWR